ncbi:MAG TPA: arginyltransferase [Candidatus Binatia bacterium]|nr:arginyltransferase [Candidatus Binatia bacterium]
MTGPRPRLLFGAEHRCSYLEDRMARSVFIDPQLPMDPARYGALLDLGFRRSGTYVYRPACGACQQCRPARVPVARFVPTRAHRRCLKRNEDLHLKVETELGPEHFALYRRYLYARHPGGGMNPEDRVAFRSFLASAWGEGEILALRDAGGRLLCGAVVDRVPQGLSAVYTYYEPDQPARSLGTCAILRQIARAQELGLSYLYLGYWIPDSRRMDYKKQFQPLETLGPDGWRIAPA